MTPVVHFGPRFALEYVAGRLSPLDTNHPGSVLSEDQMQDSEDSVAPKSGIYARLGPGVVLACSVLTIAVVLLPWAKLQVSDPALEIRSGWYSGIQLMFPLFLILLMLIPLALSVLMLFGKDTEKRALEVGLCCFAMGMEFMLLCILFGLTLFMQDLANKVDLFEIGLGIGFWIAICLLLANVAGVILTSYGARADTDERFGVLK